MTINRVVFCLVAGLASITSAACDQPEAAAEALPEGTYATQGEVRGVVTEPRLMIRIAHEDIPDYMRAMTMPFFATEAQAEGLSEGDRVRFTFRQVDDGHEIVSIERL